MVFGWKVEFFLLYVGLVLEVVGLEEEVIDVSKVCRVVINWGEVIIYVLGEVLVSWRLGRKINWVEVVIICLGGEGRGVLEGVVFVVGCDV